MENSLCRRPEWPTLVGQRERTLGFGERGREWWKETPAARKEHPPADLGFLFFFLSICRKSIGTAGDSYMAAADGGQRPAGRLLCQMCAWVARGVWKKSWCFKPNGWPLAGISRGAFFSCLFAHTPLASPRTPDGGRVGRESARQRPPRVAVLALTAGLCRGPDERDDPTRVGRRVLDCLKEKDGAP